MSEHDRADALRVVQGEFYTDGEKYVLSLRGVPISGVGSSLQAAFDNLMQAQALAGDLPSKLMMVARDQQSEQVRATLIRVVAQWLIVLTVVGGVFAAIVTLAPMLAADMDTAAQRVMDAAATPPAPSADAKPSPP